MCEKEGERGRIYKQNVGTSVLGVFGEGGSGRLFSKHSSATGGSRSGGCGEGTERGHVHNDAFDLKGAASRRPSIINQNRVF